MFTIFISTHLKISNKPFKNPQGPVSNVERAISKALLNHTYNTFFYSPSFQSSMFFFDGSPPEITLSLNAPIPDPYQQCHQTLALKLDPKFLFL